MNRRQARAYVMRILAAEARHHIGNGSAWIEYKVGGGVATTSEMFSEADQERIILEIHAIADELDRRSRKLAPPAERA